MNDGKWRFTDLQADHDERNWIVAPATEGRGITVQACDDAGGVYDQVTLRRFGAFVVFDFPGVNVPEYLEFLRPAIEHAARRRLLGIGGDVPPFLVSSESVRRMWEFGHLNLGFGPFRERGTAVIFDVRIVWDSALDGMPGVL
jgi:hypothetical protein